MRILLLASITVGLWLSSPCRANEPVETRIDAYGLSKASPVEVCAPQGQRQYLSRLVCKDGTSPAFRREGSLGPRNELPKDITEAQVASMLEKMLKRTPLQPGEADYHVVDAYEVTCGEAKSVIYMDMYHCGVPAPTVAPGGFGFR
jgi:hypothetical protein